MVDDLAVASASSSCCFPTSNSLFEVLIVEFDD